MFAHHINKDCFIWEYKLAYCINDGKSLNKGFVAMLCSIEMLGLLRTGVVYAQTSAQTIRAAHIFNIGRFVKWNVDVEFPDDEYRICVVDDSEIVETMKKADGKELNGHKVRVTTFQMEELGELWGKFQCHAIYVANCTGFCPKQLEENLDKPVTTISDRKVASVVTFVDQDKRVKFNINRQRANKMGYDFSSKLLALSIDLED